VRIISLIILGVSLLSSNLCFGDGFRYFKQGSWGTGFYNDFVVSGNYAYIAADGNGMDVVDLSVLPGNLSIVANLQLGNTAHSIAVSGNYAYVGLKFRALAVINISDPLHPVEVGRLSDNEKYEKIDVLGNYVYVVSGSKLIIYDVSTPSTPTKSGEVILSNSGTSYAGCDVAVADSYVFVGTTGGVFTIDVTTASSPSILDFDALSESAMRVKVLGMRLYVGNAWDGFAIYDITTPANPVFIVSQAVGTYTRDICVDGNDLYCANLSDAYKYDITDTSAITLSTTYSCEDGAFECALYGTYFLTTRDKTGLSVFTKAGVFTTTLDKSGEIRNLRVEGNYCYAMGAGETNILSISDPTNISYEGKYTTDQVQYDGHIIDGDVMYVCDYSGSWYQVDISTPSSPTENWNYPSPNGVNYKCMKKSGNFIYCAGNGGLEIFDISDIAHPSLHNSYGIGTTDYRDILISGTMVALVDATGDKLVLLNINDVANPSITLYKTIGIQTYPEALALTEDDYMLVGGSDGLEIIYVSNPSSPVYISVLGSGSAGQIQDIELFGNIAIVAGGYYDLRQIDITDKVHPELLDILDEGGYINSVAYQAPYLYVSSRYQGTVTAYKLVAAPCDLNRDGKTEMLLRDNSTGSNKTFYLDGITKDSEAAVSAANANYRVFGTGDFNGDGYTDIVMRHQTYNTSIVYYMKDNLKIGVANLPYANSNWNMVGVGDLNDDGKPDIILRNTVYAKTIVWYMNGITKTGSGVLPYVNMNWEIAKIVDLNNDGKDDMIIRHPGYAISQIWYLNGIIKIGGTSLPYANANWSFVGYGDFDDNSKTDLLLRNQNYGTTQVWYMDSAVRTGTDNLPFASTNWNVVN